MPVSAVVFDFDNTLAVPDRPREELLADATETVGGVQGLTLEAYRDAHRSTHTDETRGPLFAQALPEDDDTDPEELATAYRETIVDALFAVEGVPKLLTELREEYRIGLLTNGPRLAQRSKLEVFDWVEQFHVAAVTGELPAAKPDERAFGAVLSDLGVAPERAVYVGDDPEMDVAGGNAAGLRTVQVLFDGGPDPVSSADAHVQRETLRADLPRVVADF
ncbi:HAD family hydrolase [Halorussus halophilus]|uniref:HAD family hydrolase n=1 Tax=Halorussus halophilus TaxID=2650975 RepID=UPI001301561B|nr:HAD family hydrolase [Halorussus halophilus]